MPNGTRLHVPSASPWNGARGIRGDIRGLSRQARMRLTCSLCGIDWEATHAHMATLTYHWSAGADPAQWHLQLRAFGMRLFRDWEAFGPSVLWAKEFQRRGAVHYHLLIFWKREPHTVQLRRWIARSWNEIAEPGDEKHAKAGTSCDPVRLEQKAGTQRLTRYLAKYLAKGEQKELRDPDTGELQPTGRMWGQWGRIPQKTIAAVELDEHDLAQLYRRIRRWGKQSRYLQAFGKRVSSGIVLADSAAVLQLLRGLGSRRPAPGGRPP